MMNVTAFITAPGNPGTYIIPSDFVSFVSIECIGTGASGESDGEGGGGGAYAKLTSGFPSVMPGNSVNYQLAATGSIGTGGGLDTWFSSSSTVKAASAGGGGHAYPGGLASNSIGNVKFNGGNGGTAAAGGNGGGGAGGPNGAGALGGNGPGSLAFFVVAGGGGGGGSGGGAAGTAVSGAGSSVGGNGGNNFGGTGQGIGGAMPNANGTDGSNGGGGGGAFGSGGPSPPYNINNAGNGGSGSEWTATIGGIAGSGGGGGSGPSGYNSPGTPSPGNGGAGGLYGGGGGSNKQGTGAQGQGAQGIIVITYVSSAPPSNPSLPYREFEDLEDEEQDEPEDTFQPRVFANVVHPCFSTPALWRTDVEPSSLSSYVECEPMEWIYQTVLLPDNLLMAENCVIETNLAMAFLGSLPTVTCEAFTSNDFVLGTLTIPSPDTDTIWGQFLWGQAPWGGTESNISEWRVAWTEPLIFKQMTFKASGQSTGGFKIGNLYLKYQILGYRQQQGSGDR